MTANGRPGPSGPGSPGPTGPAVQLTVAWVAAAVSGVVLSGDRAHAFTGVSIDTRTLKAGELYVAIRGERFDGADFADAAIVGGAAGVIVPRGRGQGLRYAQDRPEAGRAANVSGERAGSPAQPVVIEVDDTTAALQALAHAVRIESGTKVVAITGSAGKTTTKEITAEFLAARYRVIRNQGNFNNHIGLPLSLIELTARPEIAVVELGMSRAGEISTLVRVAEPDVRVWTNVGEAHLGFFASLDATADAKAEILEGADAATVLVANADDERIAARLGRFAGRTVTFGIERDADVRAAGIVDRGIDGMSARVSTPKGDLEITTPLVGHANLANLLAATAVAVLFDGVTIVDDSYNANPTATLRALDVLAAARRAPRRVAVLGEMLELGDRTAEFHEDIGRAAARAGVDLLIAVGGSAAAALAAAAVGAGLPPANVRHFATSDDAADAAAVEIRSGDLVLVKGSRGVRTDRIVDRLKAEFA